MTTQNTCKKHRRTKRPDERLAMANKARRLAAHLTRHPNAAEARKAFEAIPKIYRQGIEPKASAPNGSTRTLGNLIAARPVTLSAARRLANPKLAEIKDARTRIRLIVYGQQSNRTSDLQHNPPPSPLPDKSSLIRLRREIKDLYPLTGWGYYGNPFDDEEQSSQSSPRHFGPSLKRLLSDFDRRYSDKPSAEIAA